MSVEVGAPRRGKARRRVFEATGWLLAAGLSASAVLLMHSAAAKPFHTSIDDPLALPRELTARAGDPNVPLPGKNEEISFAAAAAQSDVDSGATASVAQESPSTPITSVGSTTTTTAVQRSTAAPARPDASPLSTTTTNTPPTSASTSSSYFPAQSSSTTRAPVVTAPPVVTAAPENPDPEPTVPVVSGIGSAANGVLNGTENEQ